MESKDNIEKAADYIVIRRIPRQDKSINIREFLPRLQSIAGVTLAERPVPSKSVQASRKRTRAPTSRHIANGDQQKWPLPQSIRWF
jgi:hypothetical protein